MKKEIFTQNLHENTVKVGYKKNQKAWGIKMLIIVVLVLFSFNSNIFAVLGTSGHFPTNTLDYQPTGYTSTTILMRQGNSITNAGNGYISDNDATDLYVDFTFDTTGKNVYLVYTTDGSTPSKANGTTVSCSFSAYVNSLDRVFVGQIPASANTANSTLKYIFYISNSDLASSWGRVAADGYNTSWTEANSFFSYVVYYSSNQTTGNWSSTTTWKSGSVPASGSNVIILGSNTITLNQDATVSNFIIRGAFTGSDGSGRTLTISNLGTLTNNGTFTSGAGTVAFAGAGTVSGTVGFNNVILAGGVNFGSGSTVNGFLNIHLGGYVNANAPTYATGSTLKYNSGTSYGASAEWATNTTTGAGVPCNVVIGDEIASSGVTFGSSSAYRYANGNITISNATSGSSLILSTVSGGDLELAGDFTNNGTFNASSRAIFFIGGNSQNINGTQTNISYVIINKTGGSVNVVTNLISDVLTLTNGTLNVNAGKQLTVNTTLTNNGTLNLLSTNTDGTATILTPATLGGSGGTYNVNQYLPSGRNWYLSSPIASAPTSIVTGTTGNALSSYIESTSIWSTPTTDTNFGVSKGYVANMHSSGNVTFTGGALNNGTFTSSQALTSSGSTSTGFNLVGNPYPSYLNWESVLASSTNMEPTIWYRTQNGSNAYVFDTYNATSHIGTNNNGTTVTQYIAPMQAVWARVTAGNTGTLGFGNAMRSHQDQSVTTNRLKAPAVANTTQQLLRLQVSNAVNSDEAIVLFNPNASDGFDAYDSEKMSNNNAAVPEIYTLAGTEQVAINGLNSITTNPVLPLGFTTGASNTFTIKASEVSNFDANTRIVLRDNLLNTEQDLTDGTAYTFASDVASTTSRFSVVFKSVGMTTGLQAASNDPSVLIYKNANNQIAVNYTGSISDNGFISVYNTLGQKLESKQLTTTTTVISRAFASGVYVVTVNNGGKSTTRKVILN